MREVYFHRDNKWFVISENHDQKVLVEELEEDFVPPPGSKIIDAPKEFNPQQPPIELSKEIKKDFSTYAVILGLVALGIVLFTITVM